MCRHRAEAAATGAGGAGRLREDPVTVRTLGFGHGGKGRREGELDEARRLGEARRTCTPLSGVAGASAPANPHRMVNGQSGLPPGHRVLVTRPRARYGSLRGAGALDLLVPQSWRTGRTSRRKRGESAGPGRAFGARGNASTGQQTPASGVATPPKPDRAKGVLTPNPTNGVRPLGDVDASQGATRRGGSNLEDGTCQVRQTWVKRT